MCVYDLIIVLCEQQVQQKRMKRYELVAGRGTLLKKQNKGNKNIIIRGLRPGLFMIQASLENLVHRGTQTELFGWLTGFSEIQGLRQHLCQKKKKRLNPLH